MCKHFLTTFETYKSHDEPFIEIWNRRPLLMSAYSIVQHQQGCSVEQGINVLRLLSLEVTNSHVNWIPVRQQDLGSTKNSITNYSRIRSLSAEPRTGMHLPLWLLSTFIVLWEEWFYALFLFLFLSVLFWKLGYIRVLFDLKTFKKVWLVQLYWTKFLS